MSWFKRRKKEEKEEKVVEYINLDDMTKYEILINDKSFIPNATSINYNLFIEYGIYRPCVDVSLNFNREIKTEDKVEFKVGDAILPCILIEKENRIYDGETESRALYTAKVDYSEINITINKKIF